MSPNSLPLPPGQFGLPVLGETIDFFRDSNFASKRHQQYGDVFKTKLLGKPTIFVQGIAANRFVLTHENQYFVVGWPPSTKALLGKLSLALQTGDLHRQRRQLLAQAFGARALASYIDAMELITEQYLQRWQAQGELTWYPELRNYTFDVAGKLLAGLDNGAQTPLGHWFEQWCEGLFSIPLPLPWTRFGRAKVGRDRLLQELEQIILDRQAQPATNSDALGLLLQAQDESGKGLSLAELKDQILLLLFAGHETLTSAIASFCLLMAQNPGVLAKIRAEQQQFVRDRSLTLEDLKQMPYLENVLKEVLRLIPPVGGGFRQVIQTCEFNGYQIPAGWNVLYGINVTHKNSELYVDPDRFDPDRFAQEQTLDQQKYGFVPFGGGIRDCLGKEFARLEMKIFAIHLARRYDWQLLPDQNLDLMVIPTPHPRDGLRVKLQQTAEP